MKLMTRCGAAAVGGCGDALLAKAADAKKLRTNRVRADTTMSPPDLAYPIDSDSWPRRSAGSRSPAGGSRSRVARPAPSCRTAAARAGGRAGTQHRGAAQLRPTTRRRTPCNGSPATSPSWPNALPVTMRRCSATLGGPCAALRPRPKRWLRRVGAVAPAPCGQRPDRAA